MAFTDLNGCPINVIQDDCGWFNYSIESNGTQLNGNDLTINDLSPELEMKMTRFRGLVDVIFHGTGGGSMRYEELGRMSQRSLTWHNRTIYYHSASIKRFNHKQKQQQVTTERKLSQQMARYYLLYQTAISRYTAEGSGFDLGKDSLPMQKEIQNLFGISNVPSCLQIRHLWTSICNVVSSGNPHFGRLTVDNTVARLSGHSSRVHQDVYGSQIQGREEIWFDRYHKALRKFRSRF